MVDDVRIDRRVLRLAARGGKMSTPLQM